MLSNKTIILVNLAEHRLILAYTEPGRLSTRRYSARFQRLIVKYWWRYIAFLFFRGEHLILFLAQTVARQTIEQRQFRPHRSAAESRPKTKTKTLGTSAVTPPLPDHDLDPPKFARRALEFILQDWRAVSAMLRDGYRPFGEGR